MVVLQNIPARNVSGIFRDDSYVWKVVQFLRGCSFHPELRQEKNICVPPYLGLFVITDASKTPLSKVRFPHLRQNRDPSPEDPRPSFPQPPPLQCLAINFHRNEQCHRCGQAKGAASLSLFTHKQVCGKGQKSAICTICVLNPRFFPTRWKLFICFECCGMSFYLCILQIQSENLLLK